MGLAERDADEVFWGFRFWAKGLDTFLTAGFWTLPAQVPSSKYKYPIAGEGEREWGARNLEKPILVLRLGGQTADFPQDLPGCVTTLPLHGPSGCFSLRPA